MLKPSDRIIELQLRIASEMVKLEALAIENDPALAFLAKITGTPNDQTVEKKMKDPRTMMAAIVAYLDEQAAPSVPSTIPATDIE